MPIREVLASSFNETVACKRSGKRNFAINVIHPINLTEPQGKIKK